MQSASSTPAALVNRRGVAWKFQESVTATPTRHRATVTCSPQFAKKGAAVNALRIVAIIEYSWFFDQNKNNHPPTHGRKTSVVAVSLDQLIFRNT
jgi:hypothetical protein